MKEDIMKGFLFDSKTIFMESKGVKSSFLGVFLFDGCLTERFSFVLVGLCKIWQFFDNQTENSINEFNKVFEV